jgi:TP901 family phage tail tape measure protein
MESVKLTVQVVDAQLTQLENRVNALKNTPISLKINATGLDKATKDTTALIKACTKLVEAQVQVTKAENALEKQRLSTEASANRARTAEANLAKQHAATATEQARLATQQEKTATAAKNLEIQQEKTNTAVAKGEASANRASLGFSTLLSTYLQFAAISAVRSGISDAFETMKDVDTQIINIQKVTDATDAAMDTLSERAYSTASKYGVAANEYLAAAAAFAKAGYSNYEELAELATKTQLVGDVTADVASKFLLSADAAYKFGGNADELATVLDKANVIENNYATSIEKMAAGFPNVASTASMAKVSIDELMAALGTVTAVTQESGEKASYALRSLFLNILGDVGAEIDETTKVTADSVNTLWGVISKYADESLIAAHNAGELIDPMEAIKALSEAQKDNLLEEADLMQIVMALGGKLRTNQLNALISNYDMYEEMLSQIKTATGSADQEVATMSKSWEASLKRLRNTWTQFVSHVVSSDTLVNGIKFLEKLVKLLDNGFVALIAKVVLLTSVIKPLSSGIAKLIVGFKNTLGAVKNLPRYLQLLGASEKELEAVGLSAAGAQTALSVAISGVLVVITGAIMLHTKLKQEAAETAEKLQASANAAREDAEESANAVEKLIELRGAYEQSKTKGDVATEAAKNLAEALKEVGISADGAKESLSGYADEAIRSNIESGLKEARNAKSKATAALYHEASTGRSGESSVAFDMLRALGIQGDKNYDERFFSGSTAFANLRNAKENEQLILQYYDWLVGMSEEVANLAEADPAIWNKYAVKGLMDAISSLEPAVTTYRESTATEASFYGMQAAYQTAIRSAEEYNRKIETVSNNEALSSEYRENYISTLQALYPEYAAQAEAIDEVTSAADASNASGKRFIDTLFDEKGALKDSAAATLEANGALQQMATTQAKEDWDAATEHFNSLVESLGGEDSALVVKALELISLGSEAAEAELAKMGDAGKDVGDAMQLLGSALDDANAKQELYNIITKATAATTAAGNALITKAEAALRGEAGAAAALSTALQNADSATIEYARATVQAQAVAAQANFNNLVAQLGGVTSAAVQATLAMYAAYTAFSGGGRPQGATSGAGFSKEQAELLSNYGKMQEAMKILERLDSNAYGGGGGGGGGGSSTDPTLKALQDRVSLRKQELALMQERGDPVDEQIAKQREIQEALAAQANYMRSIGSDQTDILKLSTEWWSIQNAINKLLETSQDGVNDSKEEQLKLEERILAVQEAQAALANAQKERNIRVFNSKTGQWEWVANASDVSKAKDSVKDAQEKLSEYDGDKSGYEDVISKLLTYDPNAQTAGSTFSAEGVVRAAGAGNAMTNATTTNSIGQQMNGNIYQIAGMSFTEEQARGITLYDLAKMSNNLTIYSRGI